MFLSRMRINLQSTLLVWIFYISIANCDVQISTHDIELTVGDQQHISLKISNYNEKEKQINLTIQHDDIVDVIPKTINIEKQNETFDILIKAIGAGHSNVYSTSPDLKDVYVRVTVNKEPALDTVSLVIGWIYFAAWSISFYPQIYINFRRKSVVGLNFDFLALNLIGFSLYSIFNIGLYFIDEIEEEYFARYPRGLNPVQLNDVFFAVHAAIATVVTIVQCFIYERDEQRVSITAKGIITVFAVFLSISTILVFCNVISWLDLLYYCSYVKLTITLIKYIPQAYMNYRRKSTVGWSIGNIFLDFTGGTLSILQMILNAFNYDDWISIFGDPTKFGLGLFSVVFDVFFILQHYVFYRHVEQI
ncbi:hypothetical protein WA026_012350 [Henosepilachna vigintioctopunctata]|uniref:Cystinosin n=1 Tax=Henosepilachna vigintioctopunctata TaxID=420089 RepID=A0AAW1UYN4_9CUCU